MELPTILAEALVPVLADLRSTGLGDVVVLMPDIGGPWPVTVDGWAFAAGAGVGLSVWDEQTPVERVVRVTEVVQELVLENVDNVWPPCPRHGTHPLWPDEDAMWRCQVDPTVAVAIGELPTA